MNRTNFPFSAIIGQETLKTALLLNAVDPLIGGLLVRGHKGTGKSTVARALAALLPPIEAMVDCPYHCDPRQPRLADDRCREIIDAGEMPQTVHLPTPMVELPLSASEDRIVGHIDIASALKSGEQRYEPGLLAAANRGILYVDEVNLLPDHLVDLLLDVAASGVNVVERDGMRMAHPSRFILIGTMNPEEGELRPQFLDRFGLCTRVETLMDPQQRSEIIRRRIAFENDPYGFSATFRRQEQALSRQVEQARSRCRGITVPDPVLQAAVEIAIAAEVQGHRAEITLIRAATALGALLDRDTVGLEELNEAARLCLPHRLVTGPLDRPEEIDERIGSILDRTIGARPAADREDRDESGFDIMDNQDFPGSAAAGSMLFTYLKKKVLTEPSNRTTTSS